MRALTLLLLVGCTGDRPLDNGGGATGVVRGKCAETLPPATCQLPDGPAHPTNTATVASLLAGRWLYCGGDSIGSYTNFKINPPDHVGLSFTADGKWSFLFADSQGVVSPGAPGSYDVLDNGQGIVELMMSPGVFPPLVTFTDSPLKLHANFEGHTSYYIFTPPPDGC